jgi:CO/xanthine dehydrogenase Mo-binding subunit
VSGTSADPKPQLADPLTGRTTAPSGFGAAMPPADGKPRLPGSLHLNRRLSQWLSFHADGRVTITPGKVELGQGILTTLSQIAADELDVDFRRVTAQAAATPDSPDEAVTSGSLSTQDSGGAIRHACAAARAIFTQVVAQRTGISVEAITVEDGIFHGPAGAIGSYWDLADQALLECEATPDARAKPATARRIAGSSVARIDLPDKVFGAARYVHDLRLAGMLQARMVRPPARRAVLTVLREGPLPGDARVVRDGSFLAVLATTEWDAEAAATRLAARASWDAQDTLPDQALLADWLREAATRGERSDVAREGTAAPAARTLMRSFFRPYLAHASIAPSCAVARWEDDTVTVWTHSQGPYNLRADLAKALRCPPDKVVVRHMEGAGCYGHNGADDVALDAVLAARAVPGTAVRMLWSRAEELGWSPFSPAMLVDVEADLDAAGNIAAWRSHIISNGHSSRPGRAPEPTLLSAAMLADPFAVKPSINPPMAAGGGAPRNGLPLYAFPTKQVETTRLLEMPVRTSALRGLGATINVWSIESLMDEAAALAGTDPLEYRLRHLDDPRAVGVLARVAAMSNWRERQQREGWGLGLGFARYKNTGAWAAVVAEVEARERVYCRRLWIAGDVGEVVNPDGVANQFEGGAIHGTSVALREEVRFDRRRVTSDSWEEFPILRFSEVPKVAVDIIARPDQPFLGAGEASMAPTIAAIAGGIHQALGIRPRALPFTPDNLAKADS